MRLQVVANMRYAKVITKYSVILALTISYGVQAEYESLTGEVANFNIYDAASNVELAKIEKAKGRYTEAIFALERAIAIAPENMEARLLLAKVYIELDERSDAKKQLALVADSQSALSESARSLLRELRYVRKLKTSGFVGVRFGYDTNINSGIGNTSLFIPSFGGTLELNDAAINEEAFHMLYAGGNVDYQYTEELSFLAKGFVSKSKDSFYDPESASLSFAVKQEKGLHEKQLSLSLSQFDYSNYDTIDNAVLGASYKIFNNTKSQFQKFYIDVSNMNYDIQNSRDDVRTKLAYEYGSTISSSTFGTLEVALTRDVKKKSAFSQLDYNSVHLGGSVNHKFSDVFSLKTQLSYAEKDYVGNDVSFLIRREDETISVSSQLTWLAAKSFYLRAGHRYIDNDSNITLYDFDKNIYYIESLYRF
jgi:tetratricopeptide (TPR) repeat protein